MKIKCQQWNSVFVDLPTEVTQKTMVLPLTTRPPGAVGAEGAGTGLSAGEKGGGGPPAGQAPRPPCAAVFAARDGGRGAVLSPAAWQCGRARAFAFACTAAHVATLALAAASMAPLATSTSDGDTGNNVLPYSSRLFPRRRSEDSGLTTNQAPVQKHGANPRPPADGVAVLARANLLGPACMRRAFL